MSKIMSSMKRFAASVCEIFELRKIHLLALLSAIEEIKRELKNVSDEKKCNFLGLKGFKNIELKMSMLLEKNADIDININFPYFNSTEISLLSKAVNYQVCQLKMDLLVISNSHPEYEIEKKTIKNEILELKYSLFLFRKKVLFNEINSKFKK